jgi:hypothetical protein
MAPLDGNPEAFETTTVDPFVGLFGDERLKLLADMLRQSMPKGFAWDFNIIEQERGCGTAGCALGLCAATSSTFRRTAFVGNGVRWDLICEFFGMRDNDATWLFLRSMTYHKPYDEVTPRDVADEIDSYLATGRAT